MVQVICDKCGKDCDLNAYVITINVIHNPNPHNWGNTGNIHLTDDNSHMRMCLCQACYGQLNFPNIYEVIEKGKLSFDKKTYEMDDET